MQDSFTGFFSEAMSGTVSLGAAFGNLAKSIIGAIQQIVAKLIATKLIEMLVGLAFSFFGGSGILEDNLIRETLVYEIRQVASYGRTQLTLNLALPSDGMGFMLPNRQYVAPDFPTVLLK